MEFIDDLLAGVFVPGKGHVEDAKGRLVAYPTWTGEVCDGTGEPELVFQDFNGKTYSLYSPDERYLGSGSFSGLFVDARGTEHQIPVLGKLANKAKKLYSARL